MRVGGEAEGMAAMMAARAAAVTRPPTPSSSSSSASSKVDVSPRTPVRLKAPTLPQPSAVVSATSVSLLALFSAPSGSFNEAKAFSFAREEILSSLTQVRGRKTPFPFRIPPQTFLI